MRLDKLKCPECGRDGTIRLLAYEVEDGDPVEMWGADISCIGAPEEPEECCGSGWVLISNQATPWSSIQILAKYLPRGGDPVRVEFDEQSESIISYTLKSKRYEVSECVTLLRVRSAENGYIFTYFGVRINTHRALILSLQDADEASIGSDALQWSVLDHGPEIRPLPLHEVDVPRSPRPRRSFIGYRLVFDVENQIRTALGRKLGKELDEILNRVPSVGSEHSLHAKLMYLKNQAREHALPGEKVPASLLSYADWPDYIAIFETLWQRLCPNRPRIKKRIVGLLHDLRWLRNAVCHMHELTEEEFQALRERREKLLKLVAELEK